MWGWVVGTRSPRQQLQRIRRAVPTPGPSELLVAVQACGVCRTDLHLTLGEVPPRRAAVIPGHQVVGEVVSAPPSSQFGVGDRVGIGWLRQTCGACQWCRDGRENLCPQAQFTGWDADGGFAEYAVVPAAFAHAIPSAYDSVHAAPLLCAGIIGYRALRRANLRPGGTLGIWGFGSSAHITAQIAQHQGAEVMVMTRGERNRDLARRLKVAFVGESMTVPPRQVDASIVFAPAGELVPAALAATVRGGTVALAGIHMSEIPPLDYQEHLFGERDLRTVTANTRADAAEFLTLAGRLHLEVHAVTRAMDRADDALDDLAAGRASGSTVLIGHP
jgi:propanol-preferring alcohol dehydrogenase